MASLDTNVLVRFLVMDDERQCASARKLFGRLVAAGEILYVPITVALELEWVLRARYAFGKTEVLRVFSGLLSADELSFQSEGALEAGLHLYEGGAADFADCLHLALAHQAGRQPMWTFDRAAARLIGAQRVPV